MRAGVSELTQALADRYAVWVARGSGLARCVERGRRRALALGQRVAAEFGLPFPWAEASLSRTDYAEVRRLLQRPGCPVCRHVAETTARAFFWFLMEGYGEGAWVDRLVRSSGFCPRHMWQLADSGLAYRVSYVVQYLSEALHRRLVALGSLLQRGAGRAAARERARLAQTEPCPMCVAITTSLDWLTWRFVRCLANAELAALYASSDGLCWPHFQRAVRQAEGAALCVLSEVQMARLEAASAALAARGADEGGRGIRPVEQATRLLSGWPFRQHLGRSHDGWAAL
jgi:hypothetical protein